MATTATKRRRKTTDKKQNKSAAIRAYLKAHKGAKPKEVIEALSANGLTISPNLVSIIKGKMGSKKTTRRAQGSRSGMKVANMEHVVQFVRACGGMNEAKKQLLSAEQLVGLLR